MEKEEINNIIKEKYGVIASGDSSCCCSCGCETDSKDYSIMSDDYSNIDGYFPEADLNLGCGLPTEYAGISQGDTVLDLGSGAGNDVFIACGIVGKSGKVIGIDITEQMLAKANANKDILKLDNVEFRYGDIENMPIENDSIDVVISNCVLNLVYDKQRAFSEIYRVLKKGGHFCVSDIVLIGELDEKLRKPAELYAGCVAGAIQYEEYLSIIEKANFQDVKVHKHKKISLPKELLEKYISSEEAEAFDTSDNSIFSITVSAYK